MQGSLFAPDGGAIDYESRAMCRFEIPVPWLGRLLGWVYSGDTRAMYGRTVTYTVAFHRPSFMSQRRGR
jgi:hypothetical protein